MQVYLILFEGIFHIKLQKFETRGQEIDLEKILQL